MDLPRGMRDFEPAYNRRIEGIRAAFDGLCRTYGFEAMKPAIIESFETLATKSGPGIGGEIYEFRDKGDRHIALRFDLTMGLTRYAASQRSMRLPAKLAAFGGVFRYDEPQKGRYRNFHQWDIEVYGRPSAEADAEIIEFTSVLFGRLGLDVTIDVSHRRLVESFIRSTFGYDDPGRIADVLRAVDKTAKKSRDQILDEFGSRGHDRSKLGEMLDFALTRGTIGDVKSGIDTSKLECWDELEGMLSSLEGRGVPNVRINLGIVRGLDYYSGAVFEVFARGSKLGALAGGGRYDTLTAAFGRGDIGAAGVAGGVERILLAMDEMGMDADPGPARVAVVYAGGEAKDRAFDIALLLRRRGIPTDIDLAGRGLKKQMEAARGARYSVLVGLREVGEGRVKIQDMRAGKGDSETDKIVPAGDLPGELESLLS